MAIEYGFFCLALMSLLLFLQLHSYQ